MIDDHDYQEGFRQGFRAIVGAAKAMPAIPAQPATKAGKRPFQMGILKGIAKGFSKKGAEMPQI